MRVLRTPDERFRDLPGYPFAPHWAEVPSGDGAALRMHFVDEGSRGAAPVLLLHGEPSWSYLYRKMIPILAASGLRAVAPDLVGFGRSDKPAERGDYSYQRHVDWMRDFLHGQDLRGVTLFAQDWGGLIGLRLVAEEPERFARVVVANSFLPTGDEELGEPFLRWRRFSQEIPVFPAGGILQAATHEDLPPEVIAANDAPFPDESYQAGARQFPLLVPTGSEDPAAAPNRRAWAALGRFERPFLTAFSDGDPITRGGERAFQARVPGARGRVHPTIRGAGHFLQEDRGEELARLVVEFVATT